MKLNNIKNVSDTNYWYIDHFYGWFKFKNKNGTYYHYIHDDKYEGVVILIDN